MLKFSTQKKQIPASELKKIEKKEQKAQAKKLESISKPIKPQSIPFDMQDALWVRGSFNFKKENRNQHILIRK